MKNKKVLNVDIVEEVGVFNEIEDSEVGTIDDVDDEEVGTLDIVPEVPQEFIDKYHKDVQTQHGTNNTSSNK